VLTIFYFHISEYRQFWLNLLFFVYYDLSNITKSKKKNLNHCLTLMIFLGIFVCSQSGDLEKEAIVL
jgi:hypothetical protein